MPHSTNVKPIFVACPNLSLDRTMSVDRVDAGHVHRSDRADVRGGGKGVNVARALGCVGTRSSVATIVAGRTGEAAIGLLADEGVDVTTTRTSGETRSCLTVLTGNGATVFNESGPRIDGAAWRRFSSAIDGWMPHGCIFVCSGSWPPGSPDDAAAQLIAMATKRGCTTICDTARAQLAVALDVKPDVIKPNIDEALAVLGEGNQERVEAPRRMKDARRAATTLVGRGPAAVVVSAGASGVVLAQRDGVTEFRAHRVKVVNPIGAGDSLVAGIADSLSRGEELKASVRWGIAMAAASCETFAAGALDKDRARALYASSSAI
jgi:1-phosphofructokinase family hexose kinase